MTFVMVQIKIEKETFTKLLPHLLADTNPPNRFLALLTKKLEHFSSIEPPKN